MTGDGRSVGIVRSRTKVHGVCLFCFLLGSGCNYVLCEYKHVIHRIGFHDNMSLYYNETWLHSWLRPRIVTESQADVMKFFISVNQKHFSLWFQAAQKLANGTKLAPCPRCSLPSQVDVVSNVGQCTHKNCQYLFCCICHCDSHIGSSCPFLLSFPQSRKRPSCIGSRASKRNLRRLWMLSCDMDLCKDLSVDHVHRYVSCSSINALSHIDYCHFILRYVGGHRWPIRDIYGTHNSVRCNSTWTALFSICCMLKEQSNLQLYTHHFQRCTYGPFANR
jgi:hypothetical protein